MSQRHKVFKYERQIETLIVIPQNQKPGVRYGDVHLESNAMIHLLDEPDVVNLVVDFGGLDHAGSIVIGALIRMARKVSDEGGRAVFCCASEQMQEILQTMNLFRLWPCFPTRQEALRALEQ